jgi:hypothetical protein
MAKSGEYDQIDLLDSGAGGGCATRQEILDDMCRKRPRPGLPDRATMSTWLSGVRGRVTLTVLVVTACLSSLLGTVGFLQIANSGRDAIRERVGEVLGQLETGLRAGSPTVSISTP